MATKASGEIQTVPAQKTGVEQEGKSMMYYKILNVDGTACHGGAGQWALPVGDEPGAWMPVVNDPVPCERGYHLCREGDLVVWLGPTIWEAEIKEGAVVVEADDKVVVSAARLVRRVETWTETTARLFSGDCAERSLPLFERAWPDDHRPRKAIDAARAFARGEITAAARDAAGDAAWDAAARAAGA
ncbi:MAG: hypothetical protein V2A79_18640, partial [Planctomycetota bacterium]